MAAVKPEIIVIFGPGGSGKTKATASFTHARIKGDFIKYSLGESGHRIPQTRSLVIDPFEPECMTPEKFINTFSETGLCLNGDDTHYLRAKTVYLTTHLPPAQWWPNTGTDPRKEKLRNLALGMISRVIEFELDLVECHKFIEYTNTSL